MNDKFFRVDKKKPWSIEGDFNLVSFILSSVGCIFIAFGVSIFFILRTHFWISAISIFSVFTAVGILLFITGFFKSRKLKKEGAVYDIISNGIATEGVVTDFKTIEFRTRNAFGTGRDSDYRIIVEYSFVDDNGNTKNASLYFTRLAIPKNYEKGTKIMVVFYDDQSLILKKYTLLPLVQ